MSQNIQLKSFICSNREQKLTLHPPLSLQNNRKGNKLHITDMSQVVSVAGEQPEITMMRSV